MIQNTSTSAQDTILLLHGIWMPSWVMLVLGSRLREAGYKVLTPAYNSVTQTPAQNAQQLYQALCNEFTPRLHVVGHSLGGLVGLHLLAQYPDLPLGRLVTLGSPVNGSSIARLLKPLPAVGEAFGQSMSAGLSGEGVPVQPQREWGAIIGTLGVGLGTLFLWGKSPHDGAVTVTEAEHAAQKERLYVPVTHTGLIYSQHVAAMILRFIQTGSFQAP